MATRKSSVSKGKGKGKGRASLPPRESQRITLARAVDLTQRYRKASPASEHAGFFWADGIRELLEQPGCVGLRYYHGLDEKCGYQIVFVGVDAEGQDIVKPARGRAATKGAKSGGAAVARATSGSAVILDMHWTCPPFCDPKSPLL